MVSKVMEKTGGTVSSRKILYKAVVQAVLLYGRDIWVILEAIIKVLGAFYHQIYRRIMGKAARRVG